MYEYKCELIKVVDGDTIDAYIDLGFKVILKERIRLMGIDTPESRTKNLKEKSWGKASKKFLIDQLDKCDGKFTLTTKLQKKGKFGRVLGTIMINGVDANQLLIDNKLAIPYTGGNKEEGRLQYNVKHLWEETYYGEEKSDEADWGTI